MLQSMGWGRKILDDLLLLAASPLLAYFVMKEFRAKYGHSGRPDPHPTAADLDDPITVTDEFGRPLDDDDLDPQIEDESY